MIFDRYAGEYRLKNQSDASGKIKTVPVYCGKQYRISVSGDTLKAFARKWLRSLIVNTVLFLPGLFLNGAGGRHPYVVFPYIFLLLPIYLCASMLLLLKGNRTYWEHRQRDQIERRSRGCPLIMALLSLISGAGRIIACSVNGTWSAADAICAATMLLMCVCSVGMFRLGKKLNFEVECSND